MRSGGRFVSGHRLVQVLACFNLFDYDGDDGLDLENRLPPGPLALIFTHFSARMDAHHQVKEDSPSMEAVRRANRTLAFFEVIIFARESGISPALLTVGQLRFVFKSVRRRVRGWGDQSTLGGSLDHADMSALHEEIDYGQFEELLGRCALVAFPRLDPRAALGRLIASLSFDGIRLTLPTADCMRALRGWIRVKERETSHMGAVRVQALKRRVLHNTTLEPSGAKAACEAPANTSSRTRRGDAVRVGITDDAGAEMIQRLERYEDTMLEEFVGIRHDFSAPPSRLLRPFLGSAIDMGVLSQTKDCETGRRGDGSPLDGGAGAGREMFWLLVQNVHHRKIRLEATIEAVRPCRATRRPAPSQTLPETAPDAFECEVDVRPLAPGLTRILRVFVDTALPMEMAATIVVEAHSLDGALIQRNTVPIFGACVPPAVAAPIHNRSHLVCESCPPGPVLGATFVGRRSGWGAGAGAGAGHGMSFPGMIRRRSPQDGALLSSSGMSLSCMSPGSASSSHHQLGTMDGAELARLRLHTSMSRSFMK